MWLAYIVVLATPGLYEYVLLTEKISHCKRLFFRNVLKEEKNTNGQRKY